MGISKIPVTSRVDQFFMAAEARFDCWRALLQAARTWERSVSSQLSGTAEHHAAVSNCFQELLQWEDFFAYPGLALLNSLRERITSGDTTGTVRLAQSISAAVLTHSYRNNPADLKNEEQVSINFGECVTGAGEEGATHRPYFEVLVVSPARRGMWQELAKDLRKLRRPHDKFIYESVFAGTFEDAVLATILNARAGSAD